MVAFIIVANVVFLIMRTIDRGRLNLVINEGVHYDLAQDYLSCEETELVLNLWATIVCFVGTNLLILNSSTL